jgi:hypothetical protein
MQVRKAIPLSIALSVLMASPLAFAQSDTASTPPQGAAATQSMAQTNSDISTSMFNQLDTNHDGRVSAAEARVDAGFNGRFSALDADHNGYVSSDELTAASGSSTGTASTTSDNTTTTTSGRTEAKPPVTYGNAGDSSYDQSSTNATTGNSSDLSSHDANASGTSATDSSNTTTTTKHTHKKHKSP